MVPAFKFFLGKRHDGRVVLFLGHVDDRIDGLAPPTAVMSAALSFAVAPPMLEGRRSLICAIG